MNYFEQSVVIAFLIYAILGFIFGSYFLKKRNFFGLSHMFIGIGAFVWADAVFLGVFWILASLLLLFISNWYLVLLTYSLFWFMRSLGETMYWLHQQFSSRKRNPPETLFFYRFFPNESVWIIMQLFWQCVSVISAIVSMYVVYLWIRHL